MGDHKILRFEWRGTSLDVKVDMDKCTLLDVVVDYEDEAKKRGFKLDYGYPTFAYAYNMDHTKLEKDVDLMTMFTRMEGENPIFIWVGSSMKPSPLYKLILNLRRRNEAKKIVGVDDIVEDETVNECDDLPSLNDLEDTSVQPTTSKLIPKSKTKPKTKPKTKLKTKPKTKANTILPPPPISPKTAFKNLTIRRSPKFSPAENINLDASASVSGHASASDQTLFGRKVPKTTAIRKGIPVDSGSSGKSARRKVDFLGDTDANEGGDANVEDVANEENNVDESAYNCEGYNSDDSDGDVVPKGTLPADELEETVNIPKIKENWKAESWHEFIDDENDDDYYQSLYKNGELYEETEFGKIQLRPWMLFLDKNHYKNTLKDYCIQEGFATTVIAADSRRHTSTCLSSSCDWRIHANRLPDGTTWAIKKIEPNTHTCRGLETYNPLCNVQWAAQKVMEDIRANPDIPGKALNELLFQRFGLNMKQSTLYAMKKYALEKLFGGHDESYSHLPAYTAKAAAKIAKATEKETSQKGIASQPTEMNISQPGSSQI